MKESLSEKLKVYGKTAGALTLVTAGSAVNAQLIFTDVSPDKVLTADESTGMTYGEQFSIDMNGDTQIDFVFGVDTFQSNANNLYYANAWVMGGAWGGSVNNSAVGSYGTFIKPIFGGANYARYNLFYPDVMVAGENVTSNLDFISKDLMPPGVIDFTYDPSLNMYFRAFDSNGDPQMRITPGGSLGPLVVGEKFYDAFGDAADLVPQARNMMDLAVHSYDDGIKLDRHAGKWDGVTDGYMAVQFDVWGSKFYGWIRLSVDINGVDDYSNSATITIKEYAYHRTAGTPVVVGDRNGDNAITPADDPLADSPVGIEEHDLSKLVDIYSVDGLIQIGMKNLSSDAYVRVYNLNGQKVAEQRLNQQLNTISLDLLEQIYLVQVSQGGEVFSKKVLLK